MKKNLINVGRQNIKTRRRALPEKDEPEECWPFWEKLITDFLNLKTAWDSNSTLYMHHFDSVRFDMPKEEYWCEFRDTMKVDVNGDEHIANSFVDHIATYVWVEGKVNNGKEKIQLAFSFGLFGEQGGKNMAFEARVNYFYMAKHIQVGRYKIPYENWDGYNPKVGGRPAIKSMCETYNRWVNAFKEWSKAIGSPTMKNYGLPSFAWETCDNIFPGMLKKSQVQIGTQNVKTKRSPLPEKDDSDDDCKFRVGAALLQLEALSEYITGKKVGYVAWWRNSEYFNNISVSDWCHFIETAKIRYFSEDYSRGVDRYEVDEIISIQGKMRSNDMIVQFILMTEVHPEKGHDLGMEIVMNRTGMNPASYNPYHYLDWRKHNLTYTEDYKLKFDDKKWAEFKENLKQKIIQCIDRIKDRLEDTRNLNISVVYEDTPTSTFPDSIG